MIDGSEYFPELDGECVSNNKHGIFNLRLVKNKYVVTGFQWCYPYFEDGHIKFLQSYDLRLLRKKVLEKGFDWVVLDNQLAIDSYKLNNRLVKERSEQIRGKYGENRNVKSGVNFVSYVKVYGEWKYSDGNLVLSEKKLSDLKESVLAHDGYWIVKDEEVYHRNLEKEKDKG